VVAAAHKDFKAQISRIKTGFSKALVLRIDAFVQAAVGSGVLIVSEQETPYPMCVWQHKVDGVGGARVVERPTTPLLVRDSRGDWFQWSDFARNRKDMGRESDFLATVAGSRWEVI
jgi:hypothetical protein